MAVQTKTRKAESIVAGPAFLNKIKEELPLNNAERLTELFRQLENKINDIIEGKYGKFPLIENKPFFYFTNGHFFIGDPSRYEFSNSGDIPGSLFDVPLSVINYSQFELLFAHNHGCPLYSGYNSEGCSLIKNKDGKSYDSIIGIYNSYFRGFRITGNGTSFVYYCSYGYASNFDDSLLRLPIVSLSGFYSFVRYDLIPADLDEFEKKVFELLVKYTKLDYVEWKEGKLIGLTQCFYSALSNNKIEDFEDIVFKKESVSKYIADGKVVNLSQDKYEDFVNRLINVDNVRINLSPYEESSLSDPNGGHWDLWSNEPGENETLIKINSSFYGRNPVADVRMDGIVGIDFGTKSTVVTVQDGTDTIVPMRIGCGDYKKDVAATDYENPTVMEFIDLERFSERYNSSKCRPETEWLDLTISHTASDSLNTPKSGNEYYAWFSDLKQWASDKNRKVIIKDKLGKEQELSPFTEINDADLNPIEYYAYLLGLFINNMYNGIYVNYILSFPVTYERKIRQKIAVSFSNGLKKSLPKPVQDDRNVMSLFRVMEGASEPAAYAVCALQEYGFLPEEDEKVLYGIFDFGGGTTDFDFGTWQRASKKQQRRYDYVINHFGAGGDRLLGGENLLELLAYSVFKENEAILREKEIQFVKPADADRYCGQFEGSEALINDSQQAKINQKQLAEELRPLWHGEEYSKDKVKLNLYTTRGLVETVELAIDVERLNNLLRRRIDKGVENFFEAMDKAITSDIAKGVDKIHIFLAGNSSKSEIVSESFDDYKHRYETNFANKLGIKVNSSDKQKKKDYLVQKYSKRWETIYIEAHEDSHDRGDVGFDTHSIPSNDEFIANLSGEGLYWLFSSIYSNADITPDDLRNDLLNIWKEGLMSIGKMKEIIEFFEEIGDCDINYGVDVAFVGFIYSNAEIPNNLRIKIEQKKDFFHAYFVKEIATATSKFLKERIRHEVFVLYPPLGTEQSDIIRRDKGLKISTSVTRPTGKTGVAYGLLECRPGSRIKVESEIKDTDEIKFNFYTGYSNRGKFEVVTNRDIEYGKWVEFIDASESDFELYYSDLPEAAGNQMSISGVSKKICRIDETMDDAMVYIRAIEPSVLEYCAAIGEEELNKQEYLSSPKRIILE